MRILLVNWARIWDGASNGGGVNGYCQSLALEFLARGHEVVYLFSGVTITPPGISSDGRFSPPPTIRRHPDWLGVRVFEVVNSPVLAPASLQYRHPERESESPELAALLRRWVDQLEPDVVHFHNLEGLSADCIPAVRASSTRARAVLYSLHNYHTVCPQAYLLQRYVTPCLDFRGGKACEDCIQAVDPLEERVRRAREYGQAHAPAPLAAAPPVAPAPTEAREYADRIAGLTQRVLADPHVFPLPGMECDTPEQIASPLPLVGTDDRGQTAQILAERSPAPAPGPLDPAWQPCGNNVPVEPRVDPADPTANRYGVRRSRMVEALNSCDRVLAVSKYVRDRYEAVGVHPDLLKVQHIGSRVNRIVERHRELAFEPPPIDPVHPRPLRVVFMGYNNVYKGLPMLADALELMTPEYLGRLHLFLFAQAVGSIEWRFRRMEPRLAGLAVFHGYQPHDIPWMLGGKDLGLVTSIWWDNAPQTVFEFFACGVPVLAANIGGIPDFVEDGRNGMLFAANDRYDLARRLAEVCRDPSIPARLRRQVRPPKDIGEHALELENEYRSCLSSMSPNGPAPRRGGGESERASAPNSEEQGDGLSSAPASPRGHR